MRGLGGSCRWGYWKDQEGILRGIWCSVPEFLRRGSKGDFCRTRSPEYSAGSRRTAVWIPRRSREEEHLQPPGLASSLGEEGQVSDALGIPSRRWRRGSGFPGEVLTLGTNRPPWVAPPIRGGGLGLRPCRDPGIAGSPDGNPAFDRECPQGLFPW